jgi:hypothetical protein
MKPRFLLILLSLLLTACKTVTPNATPVPSKTGNPTNWIESTETPLHLPPTEMPLPTLTLSPTVISWPTPNADQLAILERLRMVYVKAGNLYVQDGLNPPRQLTYSGQDRMPSISDDGEKIIFFRGKPYEINEIYSINFDGTHEQPLMTSGILTTLNLGYSASTEPAYPVFVPGTHQILFGTQDFLGSNAENRAKPNKDLLLVDINSAKILRLLEPGKVINFDTSPNGRLIAVQSIGQVMVLDLMDGGVQNELLTYPTDFDDYRIDLFWRQDSSQLFILTPEQWSFDIYENPTPLVLWQCLLNGELPIKVRFTPAPMRADYAISPDGNWIVYTFYHHRFESETDRKAPEGIYIGNLQNGSTKLAGEQLQGDNFLWAPNNAYFIFRQLNLSGYPYPQSFGYTNGEVVLLKDVKKVIGWIDVTHYLYDDVKMGELNTDITFRVAESIRGGNGFDFVLLHHAIVK